MKLSSKQTVHRRAEVHPLRGIFCLLLALLGAQALNASASQEWRTYIAEHAVPLKTEADPLPAALLEALKGRELVLLGETTHGTREYYTWRSAITRALIREAGIQFIAVEGDWTAIDPLDRYVRHLSGHADSALEVLQGIDRWAEWMWANPEILELAEWLHAWNADRPIEQRVGIHGIDVYGWGASVKQLPAYLDRLESGWGARANDELAPLRRFDGDTSTYARSLMQGQPTGAEKVRRVLERLKSEAEALRAEDADAYFRAKQHVSVVAQAKEHLRQSVFQNPRSWNPRAENFLGTVLRLREYYGDGARGVLWAHNTHIGDARHTPMAGAGLSTVGQDARETLGEDAVYLLGFSSDRGTFRAGPSWGAPGEVFELTPAQEGSIDRWLADAAPERAFLPLEDARKSAPLLRPAGHRAVGIVHASGPDTSRNYVPSTLPWRYDGLIFIAETSALPELGRANPRQ